MIKHRVLATSASIVMFFYYLFCSVVTILLPDFSFGMYALSFHGIRINNLQASVLTVPEMLVGATFYAGMVWILVCSVGWVYERLSSRK
ncbi:hypothetical protein HYV64_03665 [Candidatus Shapirobacteria bacterium]|nr:hypothetical protein [Candidatus Shapirobacteria bacterium]